ncbi:MAG TPA: DUF423 domain-containing protein [Bryobacteraceae bacterium]|nr:DUF423 domain-containing protein [Bryobacteraceae bacterium]
MTWTAAASLVLALAVALGAFGAHSLKGRLDEYSMGIWEKAVLYHFLHGLGMLIVSIFPRVDLLAPGRANLVAALLLAGILLFSGSLYVLAVSGVKILGAVTPFGGLSFIAAWILLAFSLKRGI